MFIITGASAFPHNGGWHQSCPPKMEEVVEDQEGVYLKNFFFSLIERVEGDITRIATLKKKLGDGSFHYPENGSQNDECALSGTLETIDLLDSAVQILCINIRREDVSFYYSAAKVWNEIPPNIRQSPTIYTFKKKLKDLLLNRQHFPKHDP